MSVLACCFSHVRPLFIVLQFSSRTSESTRKVFISICYMNMKGPCWRPAAYNKNYKKNLNVYEAHCQGPLISSLNLCNDLTVANTVMIVPNRNGNTYKPFALNGT